MASERTALHKTAGPQRRPAASTSTQRRAGEIQRSPAQTLQQRVGNQASQILIARSRASQSDSTSLPGKVSRPHDPAELEAEETARKVMRTQTPSATGAGTKQATTGTAQRSAAASSPAPAATSSSRADVSGGAPLSPAVRSYMEPRFGTNFGNVRVHTSDSAAQQSANLNANAFTVGDHVFFGRNQYQPDSASGRELIAHELTHTIQQGATASAGSHVQRKAATPAAGDKAPQQAVSSQVVDISGGVFAPSQTVKDEIAAQGNKGLLVRVVAKAWAGEGQVKARVDRGNQFDSMGKGSMPLLNPWLQEFGQMYFNFGVNNNVVTGFASLSPRGGNPADWFQTVKNNAGLLGGAGLKVAGKLPKVVNKFADGKLTLSLTDLNVEVGGFLDAQFKVLVENANKPQIEGSANVNVKGVKGTVHFDNTKEKLTGEGSLSLEVKGFSGSATGKYLPDGTVDICGKAAYNADKLSGEVEFVATDLETANNFAKDAIAAAGGLNNVQDAPPPAPVPAPKSGKKARGIAAAGQLAFNLTQWFAGTVNVVVDANGHVTVIGKIAPPGEIPLFGQKNFDKELIKFEAKAYYGIPVVGNLNLFANISLHAIAMLGPAKIYKIEVLGTYSTDPEIQKNIQISGSINISAYAGLRLRAEGGAGIEILDHDLKFGIGLNADIGVKAYAEARPTIGFRDPGQFYISGTLEMVAQPMLGLGGDFFIEIETPWWSPISDHKWTWPLFSKEWPLTDPIGLNAVVKDYVLGSGTVPEIELKKPEFDPSKFMTAMVDDTLPSKSGGPGEGQGTFKDDGSVTKPVVPPKKPAPPKPAAKPGKKGVPPAGGKSAKPDAKAQSDQAATKQLKAGLDVLKKNQPYSKPELDKALGALKNQAKGVTFNTRPQGEKWIVTQSVGKKKNVGQIELAMKKGEATTADSQKALAALDQVTAAYAAKGATVEEMTKAINSVRKKFGFKSLTVEQKNGFWYFDYELSPKRSRKGPKTAKGAAATAAIAKGDPVRRRDETWSNGEVTGVSPGQTVGGVTTTWVYITLRKSKESTTLKPGVGHEKAQHVVAIDKLLKDFALPSATLPKGGYARGHSESLPEHKLYEPKDRKETKLVGGAACIEYETVGGAKFVAVVDSTKLTHTISGEKLRLKDELNIEGQGIRQGRVEGANLHRSHLIADRFLGSGFKNAANLIAASKDFNQGPMKRVEDAIVKLVESHPIKEFDLSVAVQLEELKKVDIVQQILKNVPKEDQAAIKASVEQFAARHPMFKVILEVKYTLTLMSADPNAKIPPSTWTIGPDRYLKV